MNIIGDFLKRVKDMFSEQVENDELNALYTQIANLGDELNVKDNEISTLRARLEKYEGSEQAQKSEKKAPEVKKAPAKAPAEKKAHAKKAPAEKKAPAKKAPAKKAQAVKKASAKK